jgi:SOS-response transcriptional repressor LexA
MQPTTPGGRLRVAIEESGKSQRRIALAIGVSPQSITNAIRRDLVSPALAQAVASATGHRWEWIYSGQDPKRPSGDVHAVHTVSQAGRRVPLFSLGSISTWPRREGENSMFLYVDAELAHTLGDQAFCLSVDDDSMRDSSADSIAPGDKVVIDPAVKPHPGDLVVAIVPGQPHALFRRYRERGQNATGALQVELVPLNPNYATISATLGAGGATLCGVMVEHRRQRRAKV